MSKIQWILNDVPSLPLSTLRVSNDIFLGDPTNLVRKFNILSDNIEAELGVPVWFTIEYGEYDKPIISVIDL